MLVLDPSGTVRSSAGGTQPDGVGEGLPATVPENPSPGTREK